MGKLLSSRYPALRLISGDYNSPLPERQLTMTLFKGWFHRSYTPVVLQEYSPPSFATMAHKSFSRLWLVHKTLDGYLSAMLSYTSVIRQTPTELVVNHQPSTPMMMRPAAIHSLARGSLSGSAR
jgi:hypothetical protein